MENPTYSEQDIQDYASGSYSGDVSAIETYLQLHPAAMAQVKQYRQLYNLLQTEPTPALSFNLADRVLRKTHQQKLSPEPALMKILPYVLVAVGAAAAIVTFKYLFEHLSFSPAIDVSLLVASAIIMVLFLAAFSFIEMKRSVHRWQV